MLLRSEELLSNAEVEVIDPHGVTVVRQVANGNSSELDVSRLSAGLFTIRVRTGTDEFISNFTVVH